MVSAASYRWTLSGEGSALTAASVPAFVVQVILLFLASTVVFDIVHYLLHAFSDSRSALLRRIGGLHATHHAFLDRNLEVHDEFLRANLRRHVIPEFLTQASFSAALLWFVPPATVAGVLGIQIVVFLGILACKGKDLNHKPIARLRAYHPTFFCLPAYHALHHVSPDAHFSSWIKLFDQLTGKGISFDGRRVVMTGASSPFGAAMRALLERHGVKEIAAIGPDTAFGREEVSRLAPALRDADILILAHEAGGEDAATRTGESYVAAIELFKAVARDRKLPIEVWAVGPEADCGAFAPHARRYFTDDRVLYRHIAPPRRGPGLPSASRAARIAFFFVRRGFHWIPATLSAAAVLRFAAFRYRVRPAPAPARG